MIDAKCGLALSLWSRWSVLQSRGLERKQIEFGGHLGTEAARVSRPNAAKLVRDSLSRESLRRSLSH